MAEYYEAFLHFIQGLGYLGIFIMCLVESTFVPVPSELTMIPAGILVAKGSFSYPVTLLAATLGTMVGSALNYWVGLTFGRALIVRFGKYIFLKPQFLEKTELFFIRFGGRAVFMGRLLPGVKHYISFVAGLARMPFKPFMTYTTVGALIWMWILLHIGFLAEKQNLEADSAVTTVGIAILAVFVVSLVAWLAKNRLLRP